MHSTQPMTILLVDDDPDCRMLIREAIDQCEGEHRICEVPDGQSALDFLRHCREHPDLPRPEVVFLDIEMPGMSGQEVLRQIKTSPELRDIPVVMMTGVSDEAQMQEAARNGANSYTIKPADAQQFLQTVMNSANYWLTVHQHPHHHLPASACRR